MNRGKVDIIYFTRDALLRSEEEKKKRGELYLEKRPGGKFLCFKKGDKITAIQLAKKMYKSLNRFSSGVRMERFYDIEDDWDQDDGPTEDDIYYVRGGRHLNLPGRYTTLPAVIPPKPKEKAAFVVQVFQYVQRG